MKAKRIFSFFFSLIFMFSLAQNKKDSVKTSWKYEPNFLVGFDVLNAGLAVFTDRKLMQGFVSSKIKNDFYAIVDGGFESNVYRKNGYDAKASGPFVRLGSLYMLAKDPENELNGFFIGAKAAASLYSQEYFAVPVRGYGDSDVPTAFPASTQSSYWLEGAVGGRVQLFETPFYIEVTAQPKYLLYSTTQEEIKPMIVPGFGKSSAKFNMGFSWNIAYSF
jgi:hypothetical protein